MTRFQDTDFDLTTNFVPLSLMTGDPGDDGDDDEEDEDEDFEDEDEIFA